MYLLDQAEKVEENSSYKSSYLIDNGQVRYVSKTFQQWNKQRVVMSSIIMMNGRVMLSNELTLSHDYSIFQQQQNDLIKKGCTTVAVASYVPFERQLDSIYKRTKHAMASSTLDYIIGFTLPLKLLSPQVLRRCRHLRVPFVRIVINSVAEIEELPWSHLSQTLSSYSTVVIPVIEEESPKIRTSILSTWTSYCAAYRIHSSPPLEDHEVWRKAMVQKVGLYPEKGAMLVGSDADYLLFINNKTETVFSKDQTVARKELFVYHEEDPFVVILRGHVIKAGHVISLKPGFGRCIQVKRPGRFLSLDDLVV
ncbi:hypothetical protein [Halalkalibacter nanhaiisediminis]|uniref:Amidohydrolase-related domain-containing protein n=1 Tax=Halalkalibacter nanhaiisediminis TaxID=688079 RepID=A0A562QQ40_9BACI|nr:hypothetical protein [Halalkalibacter nanhaiisediminis]TWI58869.1 hypothetical protein IQ10_00577 [Halalkalibacter nanhaiisediminis]